MTKRAKYHKALTIWEKLRKFEKRNYNTYFKRLSKKEVIRPKRNAKDCYEYYKSIVDNYRDDLDISYYIDYIEAAQAIL